MECLNAAGEEKNLSLMDFTQYKIEIKDNQKINYILFSINGITFKPVNNVSLRDGINKSRANWNKFYEETRIIDVDNFDSFDLTLINNFYRAIINGYQDYLLYMDFDKLIRELYKTEETKEIIDKYFDIKE